MILQALYDYYQRKGDLAPEGFAWVELPFVIVINSEGLFLALEDTREGEGRNRRSKQYLLPKPKPRSGSKSYAITHLLWDHTGYVLRHSKSEEPKDKLLAQEQHLAWTESLSSLEERFPSEPGIRAMRNFYRSARISEVLSAGLWPECQRIPGCNVAFRLDGEPGPIPCSESIRAIVQAEVDDTAGAMNEESSSQIGICLITGNRGEIARLHTRTPISKDSKSLVNFQRNSGYDSYGKEQAFNAPVGKAAEAAYTTALKSLLSKDSKQKLQVGDATTVFWAQRKTDFENHFAAYFGFSPKDDPDAERLAVKALYESTFTGNLAAEGNTRFFVLGLSPNAARISVRFWHQDTLASLSEKLRRHFDDLEIVLSPKDPGHRALMPLLCSLVLGGKAENVPPNLAGAVVRAILSGGLYPQTLLQLAVRRIRAERTVTRARAAVLKAVLNRALHQRPTDQKEIAVSLDPTYTNQGYVLGRIFAVLERIQSASNNYQEVNASIRDRFYGAFSSSPVTTYPLLMKLKNHHLKKIERRGEAVNLERMLGEIVDLLPPNGPQPHLPMEEQARFAIGYYHQRQAFFTKSTKSDTETQA
ncbi:MAG: type I-C CRISPR-associated protein Cas8c/Csd1 [Holophagaceae bacterium]|nr:type I-C CRISPR-associated protein Cas8c/Csd1 [Holophagaceae bacterium]